MTAVGRVGGVALTTSLAPDPRVRESIVVRHEGGELFDPSGESVVLVCKQSPCADRGLAGHRSYRYAALVSDPWGASYPVFSAPVDVPNTPPSARLRGPARAVAGRRLVFRAEARDADGDQLAYHWRVDGAVQTAAGAKLTIRLRLSGKHRVSVTVADLHGGSVRARRVVVVRSRQ